MLLEEAGSKSHKGQSDQAPLWLHSAIGLSSSEGGSSLEKVPLLSVHALLHLLKDPACFAPHFAVNQTNSFSAASPVHGVRMSESREAISGPCIYLTASITV